QCTGLSLPRRSSDLASPPTAWKVRRPGASVNDLVRVTWNESVHLIAPARKGGDRHRPPRRAHEDAPTPSRDPSSPSAYTVRDATDRKSTRLNSSHVK